jgi:hypothetical protein
MWRRIATVGDLREGAERVNESYRSESASPAAQRPFDATLDPIWAVANPNGDRGPALAACTAASAGSELAPSPRQLLARLAMRLQTAGVLVAAQQHRDQHGRQHHHVLDREQRPDLGDEAAPEQPDHAGGRDQH